MTARTESIVFAHLMLEDPPGCEIDVQDKKRNSPLHKAAEVCNGPMTNVRYPIAQYSPLRSPCCAVVPGQEWNTRFAT